MPATSGQVYAMWPSLRGITPVKVSSSAVKGAFDLQHCEPLRLSFRTCANSFRCAAGVMRAHRNLEFAQRRARAANNNVTRLDRTDAFGRSGIDQIAWV